MRNSSLGTSAHDFKPVELQLQPNTTRPSQNACHTLSDYQNLLVEMFDPSITPKYVVAAPATAVLPARVRGLRAYFFGVLCRQRSTLLGAGRLKTFRKGELDYRMPCIVRFNSLVVASAEALLRSR